MLKYIYGTMSSAKSANLLIKAYQLGVCGKRVLLLKSDFDTRDVGVIRSRVGMSQPCETFSRGDDLYSLVPRLLARISKEGKEYPGRAVVMIDECQFCTAPQIHQLRQLTLEYPVDVYCYGLKNTFQNIIFQSSAMLLTLADEIEHIPALCSCGNEATTHLRYVDNKPVFYNEKEAVVGDVKGKDYYKSVCQTCWHNVYRK